MYILIILEALCGGPTGSFKKQNNKKTKNQNKKQGKSGNKVNRGQLNRDSSVLGHKNVKSTILPYFNIS